MKKSLLKATRQVPCSVVFLSTKTRGKRDAMTATAMFVSEDPPLFTVSVAKHIVSHELIEKAGQFALNVASVEQVALAKKLGSTHGKDVNKFKEFKIRTEKGSAVDVPLIKGCYANIECKVITSLSASNYTVYLAEAVACKVDESLVPIAWQGNKYFALDNQVK